MNGILEKMLMIKDRIKQLVNFWQRDIINKMIMLISGFLLMMAVGILGLIIFMPGGKSVSGVIGNYFPSSTPSAKEVMTLASSGAATRSAIATASVPPTITTMPFPTFAASATPEPSNTGQPNVPPTAVPQEPSATPSATQTLMPPTPTASRMPTATRIPTSTRIPTAAPTAPNGTPQPTSSVPNVLPAGLECIPNNPAQTGKVLSVIDGNTIKVLINGFAYNVRYIGVQISTNKHYALLASVTNNKLAFAKQVTLIPDAVDKDASGYLLRYVLVGDSMPALDMLKQGVLSTADIPPSFACAQTFQAAQQTAQSQQIGIWVPTVTPLP